MSAAGDVPSSSQPTSWDSPDHDISDTLRRCLPPLTGAQHKGMTGGRIAVLGGSARYTGAPYYAAQSALRAGADLATVYCAAEAAVPIKAYSPELMVDPVYSAATFDTLLEQEADLEKGRMHGTDEEAADTVERLAEVRAEQERQLNRMVSAVIPGLDRLHCLIVGPGLGRCPLVMRATARIVHAAKNIGLPCVIDADGLHMLTLKENNNLVRGYKGCVLTPNAIELRRLEKGFLLEDRGEDDDSRVDEGMSALVRSTEGVIVIRKGSTDEISLVQEQPSCNLHVTMICDERGGLKRSGGLGDILAGTVGAFSAWNYMLRKVHFQDGLRHPSEDSAKDLVLGCWSACAICRRATRRAFTRRRRGMTAPDVLEDLADTFDEMTGESMN